MALYELTMILWRIQCLRNRLILWSSPRLSHPEIVLVVLVDAWEVLQLVLRFH